MGGLKMGVRRRLKVEGVLLGDVTVVMVLVSA